jgi:predicted helicase
MRRFPRPRLLHSREYRDAFAADLKKSLPRIPKARGFHDFADAGRKLSDLHLSYETASPYAGIVEEVKGGPLQRRSLSCTALRR